MVYPRCQRFFSACCIQVRSAPRWAVCSPNFRQVAPCKEIQDTLGFWFPRYGYRILGAKFRILCQVNLDYGFQSLLGFRIFLAVFQIPKPRIADSTAKIGWILDSTSKNFPDPGIWTHLHGTTQGIWPPKDVLICENDRKRRIQNQFNGVFWNGVQYSKTYLLHTAKGYASVCASSECHYQAG